ncbi:hypothetical protein ILUMI_26918 [Ignelater luminosus]|uniref:PiggyBac transposable element-derived protein domain-containing protein n=1 Tax=Ignelater luminosus TaxID=2038154 RepID=A0A8K0FVT9_IGNLU|nr:hypothetical protein ILUMI_26918 [Ignelater luminosus]
MLLPERLQNQNKKMVKRNLVIDKKATNTEILSESSFEIQLDDSDNNSASDIEFYPKPLRAEAEASAEIISEEWDSDDDLPLLEFVKCRPKKFNVLTLPQQTFNLTFQAGAQYLNDKFSKVRSFVEMPNHRFHEHFKENYSADEAMVPYFGRRGCKQYICSKPKCWEYKLWTGTMCLGYIAYFDPYQGSSMKLFVEYKELGLGAIVVLQFVNVLENGGF